MNERSARLQLEEILPIDYSLDDPADVVGDLGVGRNHVVQFRIVIDIPLPFTAATSSLNRRPGVGRSRDYM